MAGLTTSATATSETQKSTRPTAETSSKPAATASPKKRENKADKGVRLLVQGRLTVTTVDGDRVVAECKGDSGAIYELGFDNGHWFCSCPARTDCSHLAALWLVTVRPR